MFKTFYGYSNIIICSVDQQGIGTDAAAALPLVTNTVSVSCLLGGLLRLWAWANVLHSFRNFESGPCKLSNFVNMLGFAKSPVFMFFVHHSGTLNRIYCCCIQKKMKVKLHFLKLCMNEQVEFDLFSALHRFRSLKCLGQVKMYLLFPF